MEKPLVKQPIYQQLYERLRERVESGEFKSASKFLTEREVSAEYDVSRTTANKALSTLVAEGLLEFRKGLGTFVRHGGLDVDLRSLVSFTDRARGAGMKPRTELLEFELIEFDTLNDILKGRMGLESGEKVAAMCRLRIADDQPVILENRWVRVRYCPAIKAKHVRASIYEYWTKACGLQIGGAEQTIHAVSLTRKQADLLEVSRGAAALLVESIGRLDSGEVLWCEETLYRGDSYVFQNVLGGVDGRRPAIGKLVSTKDEKS